MVKSSKTTAELNSVVVALDGEPIGILSATPDKYRYSYYVVDHIGGPENNRFSKTEDPFSLSPWAPQPLFSRRKAAELMCCTERSVTRRAKKIKKNQ